MLSTSCWNVTKLWWERWGATELSLVGRIRVSLLLECWIPEDRNAVLCNRTEVESQRGMPQSRAPIS
ncbi:unnamed protein product [Calypogeia fissa]